MELSKSKCLGNLKRFQSRKICLAFWALNSRKLDSLTTMNVKVLKMLRNTCSHTHTDKNCTHNHSKLIQWFTYFKWTLFFSFWILFSSFSFPNGYLIILNDLWTGLLFVKMLPSDILKVCTVKFFNFTTFLAIFVAFHTVFASLQSNMAVLNAICQVWYQMSIKCHWFLCVSWPNVILLYHIWCYSGDL